MQWKKSWIKPNLNSKHFLKLFVCLFISYLYHCRQNNKLLQTSKTQLRKPKCIKDKQIYLKFKIFHFQNKKATKFNNLIVIGSCSSKIRRSKIPIWVWTEKNFFSHSRKNSQRNILTVTKLSIEWKYGKVSDSPTKNAIYIDRIIYFNLSCSFASSITKVS